MSRLKEVLIKKVAPGIIAGGMAMAAIQGCSQGPSQEQRQATQTAGELNDLKQKQQSEAEAAAQKAVAQATATAKENEDLKKQIADSQKAPAATPAKPDTKVSEVDNVTDHEMQRGEKYTVPTNAVAAGDVFINVQRLFDNNDKTGLVVQGLKKGDIVDAPYGGDVTLLGDSVNSITQERIVGNIVEGLKASGCALPTGCERVDVVKAGGTPQPGTPAK